MKTSFGYGIKVLQPLYVQGLLIPPSRSIGNPSIAVLDRVQVLIPSHVVCSSFIYHKGWENKTIA